MSNALKIAAGMGVATDPNFSSVSLLLHGDGTNGSTTFTDSSSSPKTMTAFGNAQISTGTKKYGTGGMYFDGSGDYLSTPDATDLRFGTGAFTVEAWIYISSYGPTNFIASKGTGATAGTWQCYTFNPNGYLVFATHNGSTIQTISAVTAVPLNQWNHVAFVRDGTGTNQARIYLNGVLDFTGTLSYDLNDANVLKVGASRPTTGYMTGYIDDLRITKGVARYTSDFTPPSAAFPDS